MCSLHVSPIGRAQIISSCFVVGCRFIWIERGNWERKKANRDVGWGSRPGWSRSLRWSLSSWCSLACSIFLPLLAKNWLFHVKDFINRDLLDIKEITREFIRFDPIKTLSMQTFIDLIENWVFVDKELSWKTLPISIIYPHFVSNKSCIKWVQPNWSFKEVYEAKMGRT